MWTRKIVYPSWVGELKRKALGPEKLFIFCLIGLSQRVKRKASMPEKLFYFLFFCLGSES